MHTFSPIHDATQPPPRRLSKLDFQGLLGDEVYKTIKRLALVNEDVDLWLDKFNMLTPEPDGTSIDMADPRTRAGLMALAQAEELQTLGLTVERVEELLA